MILSDNMMPRLDGLQLLTRLRADPVTAQVPVVLLSAKAQVGIGFRYSEGRTPVADPKPTINVVVRQLGRRGDSGAWTVTAAWSPNIEVSGPQPLARVSSP